MLRTISITIVTISVLFRLITPANGQAAIGENFIALSRPVEQASPPVADAMGAVGVDHFVAMINHRYAVFEKAGHAKCWHADA